MTERSITYFSIEVEAINACFSKDNFPRGQGVDEEALRCVDNGQQPGMAHHRQTYQKEASNPERLLPQRVQLHARKMPRTDSRPRIQLLKGWQTCARRASAAKPEESLTCGTRTLQYGRWREERCVWLGGGRRWSLGQGVGWSVGEWERHCY